MNKVLENFEQNGFLILKNFISNNQFNIICEKINQNIEIEFNKIDKKKFGGTLIGNLNVRQGNYIKQIFDQLIENDTNEIIETLSGNKISDLDIVGDGNLNFQFKYNQHFHTDGGFEDPFLIINIATEDITELNGPIEIVPGTYKKKLPYWKFLLKREKQKVLLSRGDVLIRKNSLWHRGTKNISKKPRYLTSYTLRNKKEKIQKLNFGKNDMWEINENIFDRSVTGKIKENLYTRFSYLYSTFRLIRSFF